MNVLETLWQELVDLVQVLEFDYVVVKDFVELRRLISYLKADSLMVKATNQVLHWLRKQINHVIFLNLN